MNGVEILSSTEVGVDYTSNWWLTGLIFLGCIALGGIVGFWVAHDFDTVEGTLVGCLVGALIGIVVWIMVGAATWKPTTYETHYKVTIDDSVSMNEFLDRYEILDQEGKIYTVKERE